MIDPIAVAGVIGFMFLGGSAIVLRLDRQRRVALDQAAYFHKRTIELNHELTCIEMQRRLAGEKGRRVQAERRAAATGTKSETFAKLQGEVAA